MSISLRGDGVYEDRRQVIYYWVISLIHSLIHSFFPRSCFQKQSIHEREVLPLKHSKPPPPPTLPPAHHHHQPSSHQPLPIHSHRLRKTNTGLHPAPPITERRVPILQKRIPHHEQIPLRGRLRPHERRHTALLIRRVLLSLPGLHYAMFELDGQRLVPEQARERRGQGAEVEVEGVDGEGAAAEAEGGDAGGGGGAGVREEGLGAGAGGEGDGEGVGHEGEDGGGGGGGGEDEGRAGVDDGLPAGWGPGRDAGDGDGVENDLPVGRDGDGDFGHGAGVVGWVGAAEAEGAALGGAGGGAAEVEAEFGGGLRVQVLVFVE